MLQPYTLQARSDQAHRLDSSPGGQKSRMDCCLRHPTWCQEAVSGASGEWREGMGVLVRPRCAASGAGGARWAGRVVPSPTSPRLVVRASSATKMALRSLFATPLHLPHPLISQYLL